MSYGLKYLVLVVLFAIISTSSMEIEAVRQVPDDDDVQGSLSISELPKVRTKRGFFWDVFQKMVITKNLVVDQFVDTRNTLNDVYNTVNEQFSDPAPAKPTLPTSTTENPRLMFESDEDNSTDITTTTESFRISRYELGKILGRNFRGLQRLTAIELKDAFNATKYNLQEYKAEANMQFANSLAVEKKKHLNRLKG